MPREIDRQEDSESARLYKAKKFVLDQDVWQWMEEGAVGHFQAEVWTEHGEALQLRASTTRNNLRISLTCRQTQLVRKWDSHDGHYNPGGEPILGPHKHYPTKTHPTGEFAYSVTDIPDSGIDDALLAFLDECSIEARAGYQRQM